MPTGPAPARAQFEAIYRDHSRQITLYIAAHLHRTDRHLAEDLTSETFLRLWRSLVGGLVVERPRGILNAIASHVITDHFRLASSHEQPTDFAFGNHTEIPSAATDTPHLASLLADLEVAKERLAQAADDYRTMDRRHRIALLAVRNSTRPDSVRRTQLRAGRLGILRDAALNDFRVAGEQVALARAAWNDGAVSLHSDPDPLPQRNPGETFRKPPATVGRPKPVPPPAQQAA
ncbi:RNA polymerase sigma factor [Kitasatospora cheerisanensis]|uniref:Uncharacterized protein n=1 Tax=Kitasatospora cheerisanensis KCTC 2395 TaxID=1348663 RepID=A0A066YWP5_9ACTN|nr:sigma factor [Kitasatospora cheerisanensis]KDN84399.1 hypothetical protein KCH_41900 [Kitasatospora cheerisanensis KCTC 2395]